MADRKDKTEPATTVPADGAKKARKKRTPAIMKFVIIIHDGSAGAICPKIIEGLPDLADSYKKYPGCEAWTLGKKVRAILVVPGKHDLVKNVKEDDKIKIALDK